MKRALIATLLVGAGFLIPARAAATDDVTMNIEPAYEGNSPRQGTVPVAVEFQNNGPDVSVVLHVDSDQSHMTYPVELPRGSIKRLITYPNLSYGYAHFTAFANGHPLIKNFEAPATLGDENQTILLISDTSGDMAFIRGKLASTDGAATGSSASADAAPPGSSTPSVSAQAGVQDAYTSPLLAPNRAVGYASMAAVILGSGAERLKDEQVAALKSYAMVGGTLVFVGGASAPLLNDPRWQDILPAHDFHVATLDSSNALAELGSAEVPKASFTTGEPIPGASVRRDQGVLISAERGYGIGRVEYVAFNPFEAPLNRWEGRKLAMMRIIRPIDYMHAANFLDGYSSVAGEDGPGAATFSGPAYGVPYAPARAANDPFSIKLPGAEYIFTMLAIYFLAVIPANFLILKKLKRGELAWFTAPIISLAFAAEFFGRASDLYSARLSTASYGVLIAQQGNPEGVFIGKTSMFIPRGGAYDLKLKGVDSLKVANNENNYGMRRNDDSDLNAVDVGEIQVPQMPANNLAFRAMSYRQYQPVGDWFSIEVTPDRKCQVVNRSPYTLEQPYIVVGNRQLGIGVLRPGESKFASLDQAVKISDNSADVQQGGPPGSRGVPFQFDQTGGVYSFLTRDRNVALVGQLNGFRPGPQIGEPVSERTHIEFALVAKEALGPK